MVKHHYPRLFRDDPKRLAKAKRAGERLVREPVMVIPRPRAVFGPGDTVLFPRIPRRWAGAVGAMICIENVSHYIERALARMGECARRYSPGERFLRWCKV